MRLPLLAALAIAALVHTAAAQTTITVAPAAIADQKAVFATVESLNVVPARARIGGTVGQLAVKAGDRVARDQVIATVADEKLLLQVSALDAQIAGLQSTLTQLQADLVRAETLARQGSGTRVAMDQARTAADVAAATMRARTAERSVIRQQMAEGDVHAPTAGRVLQVPVTAGTVALPGDTIAIIAEQDYVLRLRVPERHAAFLKPGDPIRLDTGPRGGAPVFGTITLVYPRIEEGRVVADATVPGLETYFVGERVPVWIAVETRTGIVLPAAFITTRFGLDTVRLRLPGGQIVDAPVQRGRAMPTQAMPDGIEILSGLNQGDVLVQP